MAESTEPQADAAAIPPTPVGPNIKDFENTIDFLAAFTEFHHDLSLEQQRDLLVELTASDLALAIATENEYNKLSAEAMPFGKPFVKPFAFEPFTDDFKKCTWWLALAKYYKEVKHPRDNLMGFLHAMGAFWDAAFVPRH